MQSVYRQIFSPEIDSIRIPVPGEWIGMNIEVIAFPVSSEKDIKNRISADEKRKKRNEYLDRYLIDLSDFKFNRDEANDYE
jgi:hypothetical protein